MRKMLLSFKADVYERLLTGEKIYEHRKVFPKEPIEAYLYVSSPKKAITGIMHLNERINLIDWLEMYSYDSEATGRIESCLKNNRYAMEIADFQATNEISLDRLRLEMPGFIVPQMYYFLDNSILLEYLERNLYAVDEKIIHDFSKVDSTQICVC